MRTKLGAVLGACGLMLLAASAVLADPPPYSISVSKTASPATVPSGGGTVAFTVWVTNNGSGFFQTVTVVDPLSGCTIGAKVETSGDGDAKLETGETWSYSCTVPGVLPDTVNTANVHACHNVSACNQAAHDATGQAQVEVEEGEGPPPGTPEPTADPGTQPPGTPEPTTDPGTPGPGTPGPGTPGPGTPNPTQDEGGITEAPTDMAGGVVGVVGSQRSLLLVLSLGMLLASLILVTPTRPVRARNTER